MDTTTLARPVLTSGSQHDDVHVLGQLLAERGYENSVSRGENPFGIVDQSVLQATQAFAAKAGVTEDSIPLVPPHEARNWIGPATWDALTAKPKAASSDSSGSSSSTSRKSTSRSSRSTTSRKRSTAKS